MYFITIWPLVTNWAVVKFLQLKFGFSRRLRNFSSVADLNANCLAYHVNFGGFFIIIIYIIFFADTEQKDIFARCAFFQSGSVLAVILLPTLTLCPSRIFLPGTELLQSPFRTEFSMGSRLRCHRRYLRSYRQFLRSYHQSLRRLAIVARLAKHQKTLLNIVKHHETHVKHREPIVKHHETLKTVWNIMKQTSFYATISALDGRRSARQRRRSRGVTDDIGDCGVGITNSADV